MAQSTELTYFRKQEKLEEQGKLLEKNAKLLLKSLENVRKKQWGKNKKNRHALEAAQVSTLTRSYQHADALLLKLQMLLSQMIHMSQFIQRLLKGL